MPTRSWPELLADPGAEHHLVQIHRDSDFLADAAALWVSGPIERGDGAILVATPPHADLALRRLADLGIDVARARAHGRLLVADAADLLSRSMRGGSPDDGLFQRAVTGLVADVRAACGAPTTEVRVWSEMVDVLRRRGDRAAAVKLEAMWSNTIDATGLRLLCSYQLDNLSLTAHEGPLEEICAGHSQLIPEADYPRFDLALSSALVDVLGEDEGGIARMALANRRTLPTRMPPAESVLVALAASDPKTAEQVLANVRARLAPESKAA